jgi:hypothetical protein
LFSCRIYKNYFLSICCHVIFHEWRALHKWL